MSEPSLADVRSLSQRARLAIALRLFAKYCHRMRLTHLEINRFMECWWEFVAIVGDGNAFGKWEKSQPPLVFTGLGDPCPPELRDALSASGVSEEEFLEALSCTTEVAYTSMYGAADEVGSRRLLFRLADIATARGASWPDLAAFSNSRWADGFGWGARPTAQELAAWRKS